MASPLSLHRNGAGGHLCWTAQRFRNAIGALYDDPVRGFEDAVRWKPSVRWRLEEAAAIDHRAARLGKR